MSIYIDIYTHIYIRRLAGRRPRRHRKGGTIIKLPPDFYPNWPARVPPCIFQKYPESTRKVPAMYLPMIWFVIFEYPESTRKVPAFVPPIVPSITYMRTDMQVSFTFGKLRSLVSKREKTNKSLISKREQQITSILFYFPICFFVFLSISNSHPETNKTVRVGVWNRFENLPPRRYTLDMLLKSYLHGGRYFQKSYIFKKIIISRR